jgi:PAS domain-containing protein
MGAAPSAALPRTPGQLKHELQVHQVELEMQNDELRRAHAALEASRDRYLDLYDFAPVGYLTLTATGKILQLNLTGASLLGLSRGDALVRFLGLMVVPEDLATWVAYLKRVLAEPDALQTCELRLRPLGRPPFVALLSSRGVSSADRTGAAIRCAVVDVSARHRADEERERRFSEMVDVNRQLELTQARLRQAERLAEQRRLALEGARATLAQARASTRAP